MFLNLTHCFIQTFPLCHLVNLGVEIHLFTEFKLAACIMSVQYTGECAVQ